MHEDGAKSDVLLLHTVVQEEEDALLALEGGGARHPGVPEDVPRDGPGALEEDIVLDGVESALPSTEHTR
eukprot:12663504-Alexandrium_andersonii.AAC.1